MNDKPLRLLLFAYFYPPLGGPAVQRPAKTVKYLTRLGWQVDVITVGEILYHSTDATLLADCTHERLFRTPSCDPMYLLSRVRRLFPLRSNDLYFSTRAGIKDFIRRLYPLDEKSGWLPFAIKAGLQAVRTARYDAVMVTCGPFSAALVARWVADRAHLPLILDYRDHWTLNTSIRQPRNHIFHWLQRLEHRLLHRADVVTTATATMRENLLKRFGFELAGKSLPVFNGWDEEDFTVSPEPWTPGNSICISYFGTLYQDRSLHALLTAVARYNAQNPSQPLTMRFVGNFFAETVQVIKSCQVARYISLIPQQPHPEAIRLMSTSDILLLVIGEEDKRWVLTGKLFEYLRCRRPILALAPHRGEAADLLNRCGQHAIADIAYPEEIVFALQKLEALIQSGKLAFTYPEEYERSRQIAVLDRRLRNLLTK